MVKKYEKCALNPTKHPWDEFLTTHGDISDSSVCSCLLVIAIAMVFTMATIVCHLRGDIFQHDQLLPHTYQVVLLQTVQWCLHFRWALPKNNPKSPKYPAHIEIQPQSLGRFLPFSPYPMWGSPADRRGFDANDVASIASEEIASERELRKWWEQRSGELATQARPWMAGGWLVDGWWMAGGWLVDGKSREISSGNHDFGNRNRSKCQY